MDWLQKVNKFWLFAVLLIILDRKTQKNVVLSHNLTSTVTVFLYVEVELWFAMQNYVIFIIIDVLKVLRL